MKRGRIWFALGAVVLAVAGYLIARLAFSGGEGNTQARWVDLTSRKLATMLEAKDFMLVNVHVPYEGEIADTDAFIPYDQIGARLDELPSIGAKLVLYCRSGRMSSEAVRTLAAAGYSNLYQLAGGFDAWVSAGYPLIKGSGQQE